MLAQLRELATLAAERAALEHHRGVTAHGPRRIGRPRQ
jgi:hypothetical protein